MRDSEAQIMREVCRDIQTEPTLLPISEHDYERKVNTADNALLDISVRDCGIAVRKLSLTLRLHILPQSPILGSPSQRCTNYMKKRRKISIAKE